eukprot:7344090-Prymnesium_polylepis.1
MCPQTQRAAGSHLSLRVCSARPIASWSTAMMLAKPEPRRYSRYSVSRYSNDTAGVYQYSRYRLAASLGGQPSD